MHGVCAAFPAVSVGQRVHPEDGSWLASVGPEFQGARRTACPLVGEIGRVHVHHCSQEGHPA